DEQFQRQIEGKRILLIEDAVSSQKLFAEIFDDLNVNFQIANDGAEALEILKNYNAEIIISDIKMTGMDGFEFINELKKIDAYKNIPTIAISASVFQEQVKMVIDAGYDAFIRKPINEKIFLRTIGENIFNR
ncbi:MAG: response regulator, partial [Bacteroidales bacterium]|nr:response regulator [Bacteroidales bacterium]